MRRRLVALAPFVCMALLSAQNSTRKERTAPGALAARAGSAVPWHDTVAAAMAAARQSKRPVFWFVASVAGSPMDRKPEIERYVRGGPFSWPSTIELLRTHFECTDEEPRGALQERYGLVRNVYLEPGYLVLGADGAVVAKLDQLTTFHPEWFEAPLRRLVGAPRPGFPGAPALQDAWAAYRAGRRDEAIALATAVLGAAPSPALAVEAHWLAGAAHRRSGRPADADLAWRATAAFPDEPLAWKAALEAEGHGPFGRGFEDYLPLPPAALEAAPVDGSRLPGVYDEAQLWQRGVQFLLRMHDGRGVHEDSCYDFGGTDSLPNVHAAVTCLAGMALLAAEERAAAGGFELDDAARREVGALLTRIAQHASADAWLALSDRDEILWARAYALRFLAAWHARRPTERERTRPALQNAVGALLALQPETGVWFHEYGNPFAIATALQALHEARAAGAEVEQDRIDRGLRALAQNRTAEGAFSYGHTRRGPPRATVQAAAGRMPLCELALWLHGGSDQERLAAAVAAGFEHHGLLAAVRKYDDHADRHGYGGFFFWFDMLGRVEAIRELADLEVRSARLRSLRGLVLDLPEFDGCFVDSHELGRVYGTAMALLCLARCAP